MTWSKIRKKLLSFITKYQYLEITVEKYPFTPYRKLRKRADLLAKIRGEGYKFVKKKCLGGHYIEEYVFIYRREKDGARD